MSDFSTRPQTSAPAGTQASSSTGIGPGKQTRTARLSRALGGPVQRRASGGSAGAGTVVQRDELGTGSSTPATPAAPEAEATAPAAESAPAEGGTGEKSLEDQVKEALTANNEAALRALATDQTRTSTVITVSLAENRGALLVSLPHGHANPGMWNQAMTEDQYTAAIDQAPASLVREDQYNGVWILYGNGDRRSGAAARTTFSKLYTAQILAAGSTDAWWPGGTSSNGGNTWEWRTIYMPVNPTDDTVKGLMTGVRTLPQGQVNIAKIAFVAQTQLQYKQTAPVVGAWTNHGAAGNISTSYYLDNCNCIVIHSDAAGNSPGANSNIGQTADGTAYAVGGATGGPALTYFLNHVRHEVGHAVGNKQLDGTAEKGDDWALTYGGWAASNSADLKTATFSASGKKKLTISGTEHEVESDDIAAYLIGCIENEAEPAGNAVTALAATVAQKVAAITAVLGTEGLVKYFNGVFSVTGNSLGGMKNSGYMYPGYTPAGDPIIYASRMNPAGWWKFSKAAHDALRDNLGWYSMSSHREMFAEIYTHRYSGGAFPAAVNGKDPQAFFRSLEASTDSMVVPSEAAAGQAMASTAPATPAPTATPAEPEAPPTPTPPPALNTGG